MPKNIFILYIIYIIYNIKYNSDPVIVLPTTVALQRRNNPALILNAPLSPCTPFTPKRLPLSAAASLPRAPEAYPSQRGGAREWRGMYPAGGAGINQSASVAVATVLQFIFSFLISRSAPICWHRTSGKNTIMIMCRIDT